MLKNRTQLKADLETAMNLYYQLVVEDHLETEENAATREETLDSFGSWLHLVYNDPDMGAERARLRAALAE